MRFLVCCFLGIFGVRAYLVEKFGASIAKVDEWEATGKEVLAAWHNGTFSLAALFEAHNGDHRIVATRLWEIFWYQLNGAWDPKLMMIAKALIFAAAATFFIHVLTRGLERRFAAAGLFAALFAFPFGYQNLLWAFQSQFDFFLLASALGWSALLSGRPALALVIAALAPFTLGAGPILAASYLGYAVLAWVDGRWTKRRCIGFAACALVLVAVGVSLRGEHAAPLGTPRDQVLTLFKHLGWPYSNFVLLIEQLPASARLIPAAALRFPSADHSWLAALGAFLHAHPAAVGGFNACLSLLMLAPLLWLAGKIVAAHAVTRHGRAALARTADDAEAIAENTRTIPPRAWGALCLGGFAFLLQVASAIARAKDVMVQTRFLDVVALTGFAAAAAGIALIEWRARYRALVAIWVCLVMPGYLATMAASLIRLRQGVAQEQVWLTNVRAYFPAHDRSVMPQNTAGQLPIFEKDPTAFMNLLDDPAVVPVLPYSVTQPDRPPQAVARAASVVGRAGLLIALLAAAAAAWLGYLSCRRLSVGNAVALGRARVAGS